MRKSGVFAMPGNKATRAADLAEEVTGMGNPRRANSTKRNRVVGIVRREETHCHLCGGWVDKKLPHGLPGSPEIDELQPVAFGGSPYDRKNCRLAHRWCNRKRWHRPVAIAAREIRAIAPRFDAAGHMIDTRPVPVVSRQW